MKYLRSCCCRAAMLLVAIATLLPMSVQANDVTTEWTTVINPLIRRQERPQPPTRASGTTTGPSKPTAFGLSRPARPRRA